MGTTGERILRDPGMAAAARPGTAGRAPARWDMPGFAPMTRINCSFGLVYAAALRERDLVRTRNGGFRPIKWLDRVHLCPDFLGRHPDAQPIMITAGSLGAGKPKADILLSPGQKVAAMPGGLMRPTCARDLLHRPGIYRRTESSIIYTVFDLGEPADISAEELMLTTAPARSTDISRF